MTRVTRQKRLAAEDYTVGWVCAIHPEIVAAKAFLDEVHEDLDDGLQHDSNSYTLGRMARHNVVVLTLGGRGLALAAGSVRAMVHTFPDVRFVFLVGIGGGVPSKENDVRLGDVVVSLPSHKHGGVMHFDFGRDTQDHDFQQTGFLNQPPEALLNVIHHLRADHEIDGNGLGSAVEEALHRNRRLRKLYSRPAPETDQLFASTMIHVDSASDYTSCAVDHSQIISRPPRDEGDETVVHYGLVASSNRIIENAVSRDRLSAKFDVLCIETEAAGLMNQIPCIVVRGISDYSDSHNINMWQGHAAMTAAAYAKQVLQKVIPSQVHSERKVRHLLDEVRESGARLELQLADMASKQVNEMRRHILDWISHVDYGKKQSDYLDQLHPGTGVWLLKSEQFKDWIEGEKGTLLCHGMPGSGKTIMTSLAIEHCHSRTRQHKDIALAWIFCDFRKAQDNQLSDFLASILKQLAQNFSDVPECVYALYEEHEVRGTKLSKDELLQAIGVLVAQLAAVYIFIDALDECQSTDYCRDRFLEILQSLQTTHSCKLFITTRQDPAITSKIKSWDSVTVLEVRASDCDVRSFVKDHLNAFPEFVRNSAEIRLLVVNRIIERAKGMFLLAKLFLKHLRAQVSIKQLLVALDDLRSQMDAYRTVYTEIMARIQQQPHEHARLAMEVLCWTSRARRPLTANETQTAIAIELGSSILDDSNRVCINTMLSVCAGLVTLDKQGGVICFVHDTAQKYFRNTLQRWFPEAQTYISQKLLTYVRLKTTINRGAICQSMLVDTAGLGSGDTFYEYAIHHWNRQSQYHVDAIVRGCENVHIDTVNFPDAMHKNTHNHELNRSVSRNATASSDENPIDIASRRDTSS